VERTFFQSQNTPAEPASDKDSLPEQSSSTDVTSNGTSSDPTSLTEQADLNDEILSNEVFIIIYWIEANDVSIARILIFEKFQH